MLERITMYDKARKIYVIRPDAPQGQHIQRLGMYEDRDMASRDLVLGDVQGYSCKICNTLVDADDNFCRVCGQRLKGDGTTYDKVDDDKTTASDSCIVYSDRLEV